MAPFLPKSQCQIIVTFFHQNDELELAIAEMYRVLAPRGHLVMSDPICEQPMNEGLRNDERLRALCLSGSLPLNEYVADNSRIFWCYLVSHKILLLVILFRKLAAYNFLFLFHENSCNLVVAIVYESTINFWHFGSHLLIIFFVVQHGSHFLMT